MAYRTDGTANFNFFINRQGPRGPQGIQGPEGFSPNVQVEEDHGNTFTLRVTNKDNFFITSNLREHKEDRGGDYIRYDRAGQLMYIGDPNFATTVKAGEVRLSTVDDLTAGSDTVALTPKVYKDDITNIKSEIQGDIAATNLKIDNLDKASVKLSGNQVINGQKRFNDTTSVKALKTDSIIGSNGNNIIRQEQQNINIGGINTVSTIITSSNLSFNDTFRNLGHILCQETVTAGDNTVIEKTTNGIKISSTAPTNVVTTDTNQTITGAKTLDNSLYVNNPDMMSGVKSISTEDLHCSSIELGRVWTSKNSDYIYANGYRRISAMAKNGASIPMITCNTAGANPNIISLGVSDAYSVIIPAGAKTYGGKKYQAQENVTAGDNISIEETTDGIKISSTGGGSSEPPANMVTTDTDQTITGAKTFTSDLIINANQAQSIAKLILSDRDSAQGAISANRTYGGIELFGRTSPSSSFQSMATITPDSATFNGFLYIGGKKCYHAGNLVAGTNVEFNTVNGVTSINSTGPTNEQIGQILESLADLSTKIDNLTNRVVALETQIDGGIA